MRGTNRGQVIEDVVQSGTLPLRVCVCGDEYACAPRASDGKWRRRVLRECLFKLLAVGHRRDTEISLGIEQTFKRDSSVHAHPVDLLGQLPQHLSKQALWV
jgi:hypothetical protein